MRLIISPIRVCLTSTFFASCLKSLLTHCQLPYTQQHLPGGKAPVEWYPAGFSPWCSRSVIGQALLQANEVSRSNVHAGFPWLISKAPKRSKRSPKNWLLALLVPPPQLELINLITFFLSPMPGKRSRTAPFKPWFLSLAFLPPSHCRWCVKFWMHILSEQLGCSLCCKALSWTYSVHSAT